MRSESLDPLRACARVATTYRRYLRTSFRPADERLRTAFERELVTAFPLTHGPILEAAAPYAPGASIDDLVARGTLHPDVRHLDPEVLPPDRPLYRHQEQAIELIAGGDNALIATGTGSGKTECFLLPILDHLLRQRAADNLTPGVRALLLYPMNALANDQMKRLRGLFRPFPEITFGRYIGETKSTRRDALTSFRQRFGTEPLANELIDREAMQASPPHVLLTNYAMLEYLLLRPADSTLFDGPPAASWRFLVLDEVHVYDGAKGAELGMLLRRVRDRVHTSRRGQLRCIATSATLGRGREDAPLLVDFAQQLFDERFASEDGSRPNVIEPTRLPLVAASATWATGARAFGRAQRVFRAGGTGTDLVAELGLEAPTPTTGEPLAHYLDRSLRSEQHVVELQQLLEHGSVDVSRAAEMVFGEQAADTELVALVDLCHAARSRNADNPLLPARYHFFLRALEGAFYCLGADHPHAASRLLLSRHEQCPACSNPSVMVELAVCRKCGAVYAVGQVDEDSVFRAARPTDDRLDYVLLNLDDVHDTVEDEDEEALEGFAAAKAIPSVYCFGCGTLSEGTATRCTCGGGSVRVARAVPSRESRDLRRCLACAGRANTSIAYRFVTGADAPVAVVASALYQELPPSTDPTVRANVGGGRKLLSFADSRQDAAFFAPYLERTYARSVERRMIWSVLSSSDEAPRFGDLVVPIRRAAEAALVLDEDDGSAANNSRVRSWLFREVVGVDRRQSLDGVGLAEVSVALPREVRQGIPPALGRIGLEADEILDLGRILLDTVRRGAAVWVPEDVDISDDMFAPRNVTTTLRGELSERGVLAWVPGRGNNTRLDYLKRLVERRGIGVDPLALLRDLWNRWFTGQASPWGKVLRHQNDRSKGIVYALDPEWVTFLPVAPDHPVFRCSLCRQIWWRCVAGVCPTYLCPGTLEAVRPDQASDDHYRQLYTDLRPIGLRVEEHTAQLESQYAAEVQEDFTRGRVNVLSCSTTFELGVDVGEIQAVLLRNVPPSAANYVQRAGRAGRRSDSAALVVTFAQRRNHDLQIFAEPHLMVDGRVNPPIVSVDTPPIVRRHIHAMAFAAFQRGEVDAGRAPAKEVGEFFEPETGGISSHERFMTWLRSEPAELMAAVNRVTPAIAKAELDRNGGWIDALDTINVETGTGWLARAAAEVCQELQEVSEEYEHAKEEDQLGYAQALNSVRRTLRTRRLIDFLAQRVVLPKYGFPVDVVSMEVVRPGDKDSARVELTRDLKLALVDYAPGARLVAAKSVWEGTGLRKLAGRALLRRSWATCKVCGAFRSKLGGGVDELPCPACESFEIRHRGTYIEPSFGFHGHRAKEKPGESRPPRTGTIESFFEEYQGIAPQEELVNVGGPRTVAVRYSRQAMVTVLTRGGAGGCWVCEDCGYGKDHSPPTTRSAESRAEHQRPGGLSKKACRGYLSHVQLGHRYLTDAVEVRLPEGAIRDPNDLLSALHALLVGAPRLGITRRDVDGSLRPIGPDTSGIVLFDAVPGGAGHARYLAERIPQLLTAAWNVVADCECGEDTSCYACLRGYENQLVHDRLRRGRAREVIGLTLGCL